MNTKLGLTALAVLVVWATPSSAGFYKCVDAKGKVTYSDKPCRGDESRAGMDVKGMTYSSDEVMYSNDRAAGIIQSERQERMAEDEARARAHSQPSSNELSTDDLNKIRSLEMRAKSMAAKPSERAAIRKEIERIKDGSAGHRTADEQQTVDNALKGTGSLNQNRQRRSQEQLQQINAKHDTPERQAADAERKARARQRALQQAQQQAQRQAQKQEEQRQRAASAGIQSGGTPWVPVAGGAVDPMTGQFKADTGDAYVDPLTNERTPAPPK